MKLAIVGAGWAGLAAAIAATRAGHAVTLFEASRQLGGRARNLEVDMPGRGPVTLDNGQHILIGAYTETLGLMHEVGVDPARVLHALPLTLSFPDGQGLALPRWPAPLDAVAGILGARGWGWRDRLALLGRTLGWQRRGFSCEPAASVADLCRGLPARVMEQLIEPLCVAALNTPAGRASGQVFLRVLRDALFGRGFAGWAASNLLLPRAPLGELFPHAAAAWLERRGVPVATGMRIDTLSPQGAGWQVGDAAADAVLLACPPWEAARLVERSGCAADVWLAQARSLAYESIATVYATSTHRLALPMLALHAGPGAPAQFVFDRGQLGGPAGLLAFVASASEGDRSVLEAQVVAQAHALGWTDVQPVQTVVEKRATFACTPGLQRPGPRIAPGLYACGDYVAGPYPATLEGAVRSALDAVTLLKDG